MLGRKKQFVAALVACLLVPVVAAADVAEIRGILKGLGGGDVLSLTKAAKRLGDIDISSLADAALEDGSILDSLKSLAADSDKKIVSGAVEGAMERLGPELGNRIPDMLEDPAAAAKLFGSIGKLGERGIGATDGLLSVIGDAGIDPGLRSSAIGALGDLGSKGDGGAVEKALRMASEDSDADVSGAARKALEKLN